MITPLIILGPPRTGTNLLRDLLVQSSADLYTWSCDEINPIWRLPCPSYPSDELPPSLLNVHNIKKIHYHFSKLSHSFSETTIVEKTCANSLRIPYIKTIFPSSNIVTITRNRHDAVNSAFIKANSRSSFVYLLRKIKYTPICQLPFYIRSLTRLYKTKNISPWGPLYNGYRADLDAFGLDFMLAQQWKKCNDSIVHHLGSINAPGLYNITYENLVCDPQFYIADILNHFGYRVDQHLLEKACSSVYTTSIGASTRTEASSLSPKTLSFLSSF